MPLYMVKEASAVHTPVGTSPLPDLCGGGAAVLAVRVFIGLKLVFIFDF